MIREPAAGRGQGTERHFNRVQTEKVLSVKMDIMSLILFLNMEGLEINCVRD